MPPANHDTASSIRPLFGWVRKGTWTVLDQGLFATANFAVNILLARWLLPDDYGGFAVAFSLFLLLATVHTGFLTEPMLVFGAGRFRDRLPEYLGVLLRGHLAFSVFTTLALLALAGALTLADVGYVTRKLLVLAAAQPFILWMWLIRRSCYVTMRPHVAAIGSAGYAVVLLSCVAMLRAAGLLTMPSAFGVMTIAALVAGVWIAMQMGVSVRRPEPELRREVVQAHRQYGRWAAATGGLYWVHDQLALLLVPLWLGLAGSGALKALMNLIMPAGHILTALGMLMLPALVRARARGHLRRDALIWTGALVAGMVIGWLLLGGFGDEAVRFLYDGTYTEVAPLLWALGAVPVLGAVSTGIASVLRAQERPEAVFWGYAASALTAFVAGILLIPAYGLAGAVAMYLLAIGVEVIVLLALLAHRGAVGARTSSPPVPGPVNLPI
jgi:O-antigen/teichoic acid export membrane protein